MSQVGVSWLVAFVVAWKVTRDQRLALVAATLLGAGLSLAILLTRPRSMGE